ncbi:hypothetical protein ABN028_00215 [Actinopolymorpha sp. B17G11]|uniref:hypothetical protein n=1 Tax=Actinopolymorpha sp. B17G11 TaxID=3160861 RepID=UPI0032E4D7A7
MPARAAGLLAGYWAPMLVWFVAGYLAHNLVLRGSAWLAHRNQWLGFAGLSIGVLVLLASTIMMFHAVRPGLVPFGGRRRGHAAGVPGALPAQEPAKSRMVDEIAEAILPFLIFYGAWGLFTDEVREWGVQVLNQDITGGIGVLGVLTTLTPIPLAVAIGSWVIRAILEFVYNRRGGRLLGVGVALFEANWMFFAVISVSIVIGQGIDWLTSRVVWVDTRDAAGAVFSMLDGWLPVSPFEWIGATWATLTDQFGGVVADGVLLPLLWLIITAVVFGEEMERDGKVIARTRLEGAGTLFARLPARAQVVSELFTREIREKWTPVVVGLRFVLGAGAAFFLTFCLLYVCVEVFTGWAFIGVKHLVGPHPWDWWWPWLEPLHFAELGLREVLRIALLAAAFEICLEHSRRPASR